MKRFAWIVSYSISAAIGGLLLAAILVGLGIGFYGLFDSGLSLSKFASNWSLGLYMAMFAVMFGVLPVLFYGAPAYALSVFTGRASYLMSVCIGGLPGLSLLVVDSYFGLLLLLFGVPTAVITHFLAKRSVPLQELGANNSFKPSPLRGLGRDRPASGGPA
jgi:hypothetical protein